MSILSIIAMSILQITLIIIAYKLNRLADRAMELVSSATKLEARAKSLALRANSINRTTAVSLAGNKH